MKIFPDDGRELRGSHVTSGNIPLKEFHAN